MRVMFDTNVIISMLFFPSEHFHHLQEIVSREHTLVLSSFVIDELEAVTEKKFPSKKYIVEQFLENVTFEMAYTPRKMRGDLFEIRDMNDYPVLYTAIIENVDVLVTGDNDFKDVGIERPTILTPTEFMKLYGP